MSLLLQEGLLAQRPAPSQPDGGVEVSTVTEAMASRFDVSVAFLSISGYYATGDIPGGSIWRGVSAQPATPGYFQSRDGKYWQYVPGPEGVSIRAMGCKGDGTTSDTTAFANAVLLARSDASRTVYVTPGTYKITLPQDFTYGTAGTKGLSLCGSETDGINTCVLNFSAQSVSGPSIDFTGNTSGEIRNIRVLITGSASLATTAFLGSKAAIGGGSGNGLVLENVFFETPRASYNAGLYAGAVLAAVDRSILRNVYAYGPRGLHGSGHRPSAVSSPFQSHSSDVDWTQVEFDSVVGIGSRTALVTDGGLKASGANYFAVVSDGVSKPDNIILMSTGGVSDGRGHNLQGYYRTENQSGYTAVTAVQLDIDCSGWDIYGEFETDSAGTIFGGTGVIKASTLAIGNGAGSPLFGGTVKYEDIKIITGSISNIGTPLSTSFGIEVVGGGMVFTAMLAAAKRHILGLWRNDGIVTRTADTYIVPRATAGVVLNEVGLASLFAPTLTAYTGGSGEQLVYTFNIPANLLTNDQDLGSRGAPGLTYRFAGNTNGAASGRLRIELAQSGNLIDIYDSGAAIPAGNSPMRLTMSLWNLGTTNALRGQMDGTIGGGSALQFVRNIQAAGINSAADIAINIYVTNANSNPVTIALIKSNYE